MNAGAAGYQQASQDPKQEILAALAKEVAERPPTIGIVGVSGVGKSSTINSLFKTDLATSATVARTKEFEDVDLSVRFNLAPADPAQRPAETPSRPESDVRPRVRLRVVDAPGLGEDIALDHGYLDLYRENLDRCDAVLWVMSARNRALALDQMYLQQLSEFHDKIVFGLNQVDLVEPMEWREHYNIPSREQDDNIRIIGRDRLRHLASVLRREPVLIAYSSRTGYHLEHLFTAMLDACPSTRRWIYAGLKNFSHLDFIPIDTQQRMAFRATRRLAQIISKFND
jgi:predicted GTPase